MPAFAVASLTGLGRQPEATWLPVAASMPGSGALLSRRVAQVAVAIFDRVARRRATLLQTVLLLLAWLLGLVLAAGELVWVLAHAKH